MCATCGCSDHTHQDLLTNPLDFSKQREINLEKDILQENNLRAERNRGYFEAKKIFSINLVSSPGSGKTSLLERTIDFSDDIPIYVIEGDQQSTNDADRIRRKGTPVVQINTGNGCHLDAEMIHRALHELEPVEHSLVIIENVGNLVCPALFDLGETHRVVIMSVTEGEDKPLKYPNMFATSQLCLINKIDLLPYVDFDVERAKAYALRVNPSLKFMEMSTTKATNIVEWYDWLSHHVKVPH